MIILDKNLSMNYENESDESDRQDKICAICKKRSADMLITRCNHNLCLKCARDQVFEQKILKPYKVK